MKILDIVAIAVAMYLLALVGTQFITRFLKIKQKEQPKRVWKFELPTKQEMLYAFLAVAGLILYMLKSGFFD
jgi:sterol desaturase/sphingolipid hydroxylase (fatty acid hydroxylase superfamily)